jgi:hypothetical protein
MTGKPNLVVCNLVAGSGRFFSIPVPPLQLIGVKNPHFIPSLLDDREIQEN